MDSDSAFTEKDSTYLLLDLLSTRDVLYEFMADKGQSAADHAEVREVILPWLDEKIKGLEARVVTDLT